MKLRIQENSLRLRLTQKEIANLRDRGCVESFIAFPSGSALTYRLEDSPYPSRSPLLSTEARFN